MKVFIFNGTKIAYSIFGISCVCLIFYFAFSPSKDKLAATSNFVEKSYLAIIIDDFGNGTNGTDDFLNLDVPYTAAVMPKMPNSKEEAEELRKKGKDTILHLPMEAHTGSATWLGGGAILNNMSLDEVEKRIIDDAESVGNIVGINNHMGSKITENEDIMKKVIEYCKENKLIFIDSKTTNKSVAKKIADELGVICVERDVFLDGTKDVSEIEKNLLQAAKIAKKRGFAIAIGHVGEEGGVPTAQAIKNVKASFDKDNIELVTISEYVKLLNH